MNPPSSREELLGQRHAMLSEALGARTDAFSRRRFLELLGASLALAGAASCAPPREQIVPYVRPPEEAVPGKPLYFSSAYVLDGFALGTLVETYLGRPTKIEGNPQHPASLGATDAFAQASILNLYDPNRSQTVTYRGQISTWSDFLKALRGQLAQLRTSGGAGLRFLTPAVTSPTLSSQLQSILSRYPGARWHRWQPVSRDTALAGSILAFGQSVEPRYHFDAADVVLSLDADPFAFSPGRVRYMHDFATRRRPEQSSLSRVYALESTPSLLGVAADHRLPVPARAVEPFAFALAAALGVDVGAPADISAPTQVPPQWLAGLVQDLRSHAATSLVVPGEFQPASVHALAHSINAALGSVGRTVDYSAPVETDPVDHMLSLRQLADDMSTGQVSLLVIMGANPGFTAPADVPFVQAMSNVGMRVHLGLFDDETAGLSDWHIPQLHPLEDWGDARAYDGTASILQPTIAPLYDAHSAHEMLAAFSDQPGMSSHDAVKGYWQSQQSASSDFDTFWRTTLHDGLVANSALPPVQATVRQGWAAGVTVAAAPAGLELVFRPDASVFDGQFASNSWLLEVPRPLTHLTWDNVAMLSPATAQRLGVASEDVVELRYANLSVRAPVWVQSGQADDSVSVTLGYGRRRGAGAGQGVGFDTYGLRTAGAPWFVAGLEVVKTGQTYTLAETQSHYSMEGRDLIVTLTPEDVQSTGSPVVEQQQPLESLYPGYSYPDNRWGMVIDLNSCVGCNACIVACQSENNIPVVGKEEVHRGREMYWLRVDTYLEGDSSNPSIQQQLVPCMQCETAPCELVCPVGATVHSSEGLNDMVYNRCVGTRYCSNNCPYKVRHFNFFEYSDFTTPTLKLMRNPEVTVRSRGVMEKCSYCVQRITAGRVAAEKEDRPIRDGEVLTACQAACPSGAIVFGNLNDTSSAVARQRGLPRNYTMLPELNTRPRTTYLARVHNANPSLGQA
jgi:Fe-S-cluster-containing dehydrogenase component